MRCRTSNGVPSLTNQIANEVELARDRIGDHERVSVRLAEAAVQVMLASAYIERVREDLVEDTEVILQKMERLVRSALAAVVRETGVNLAEYGGDRYAPSYTDPFRKSPVCN